ncbi:hypothetical protein CBR_g23083 [Chara braunii]|uniref:Glycosyltransferase 2-like domain-containing protein n=1 Tax=Chara braunii TaxID=69332 RepID=A0A388L3P4_CHABU|nr:hypothetical protein CBR_g23083 [Chara braunii]|eukprot:GBG76868.1 hypothetical protein CBR_g23083 [Chara braunii]
MASSFSITGNGIVLPFSTSSSLSIRTITDEESQDWGQRLATANSKQRDEPGTVKKEIEEDDELEGEEEEEVEAEEEEGSAVYNTANTISDDVLKFPEKRREEEEGVEEENKKDVKIHEDEKEQEKEEVVEAAAAAAKEVVWMRRLAGRGQPMAEERSLRRDRNGNRFSGILSSSSPPTPGPRPGPGPGPGPSPGPDSVPLSTGTAGLGSISLPSSPSAGSSPIFLGIGDRKDRFVYNSSAVFLNGANHAYYQHGNDFGNGRGNVTFPAMAKVLKMNVTKLESYIENVLKPVVMSLKDEPGIAAWEIINNPEQLLKITDDPSDQQCLYTSRLVRGGELSDDDDDGNDIPVDGYVQNSFKMKRILRFINWQADAIHTTDPKALVTVAAYSERSIGNNSVDYQNFYSDTCLKRHGNKSQGVLDFYSVNAFTRKGNSSRLNGIIGPISISADEFDLDRPLLIAATSSWGTGLSIGEIYKRANESNYVGVLGWQADCHCVYADCDGIETIAAGVTLLSLTRNESEQETVGTYRSLCQSGEGGPWYDLKAFDWIAVGVSSLYYFCLMMLIILGYHKLFEAFMFLLTKRKAPRPGSLTDLPYGFPFVTVQLPIFNEQCVVARMIAASCKLDWPPDRFEVHILDDSTDDTTKIAMEEAKKWREKGVDCRVILRSNRTGYKAGALAYATERHALGDFIAIFDADFVPPEVLSFPSSTQDTVMLFLSV